MPIGPNGPGNPYNASVPIVRSTQLARVQPSRLQPSQLQPLPSPRSSRLLRTRPATRSGQTGAPVHTRPVNDSEVPFDRTNKFRARSKYPDQDSISVSEWLVERLDKLRSFGLLNIWRPHISDLFSWGAQTVKSFISYRFGADRPEYIDARTYGYSVGGGY